MRDTFSQSNNQTGPNSSPKFEWQPEVDIRRSVQYGVCLWWSDDLPSWIHPDDVEIAERLVPGNRVFRREDCQNFADRKLGYTEFSYGDQKFRALPAIWLPVQSEGIEIGDLVEVKSQLGKRRPALHDVCEIRWNRHVRRIEYFVDGHAKHYSQPLTADDLQPAVRLNGFLSERELTIAARMRIS